jgi:hypothetical protein
MFDNFVAAALAADAYLVYIYLCSENCKTKCTDLLQTNYLFLLLRVFEGKSKM